MADTLTTFTNFINSPPGVLVAGGALAGIVWKLFEKVEEKLNDDTKVEIAVWLLDRKPLSSRFQSWPDTFAFLVDRVFGKAVISWKSFFRSCVASFVAYFICLSLSYPKALFDTSDLEENVLMLLWVGVLPDYLSLVKTRLLIRMIQRYQNPMIISFVLLGDLTLGVVLALVLGGLLWIAVFFATGHRLQGPPADLPPGSSYFVGFSLPLMPNFVASLLTSIWLWLYAGSGFLLKAARRFDKSLGWFNRCFDIEKHPLSSIGLVAGALVALIYWAAVIVSRIV